jgi:hypothetical protein
MLIPEKPINQIDNNKAIQALYKSRGLESSTLPIAGNTTPQDIKLLTMLTTLEAYDDKTLILLRLC